MLQSIRKAEPIRKYYIAYFDLLGYKSFFQSHPNEVENFLQMIHEAIFSTNEYVQGINTSPIGVEIGNLFIRTKIFSDNILLCLETDTTNIEYPRFLAFLSIVADIQRNFVLKYGLFLRGGITIGELSFNEDFVFGQGLIDAVALEEKAIYPRIIIGTSVLDYVLQPHFVKQSDLEKTCEIENYAHAGGQASDENLAFYNSIKPAVDIEKIYQQWRDHLLFPVADGAVVLNYLYYLNLNDILGQTAVEKMLNFVKAFSPNDYQKLGTLNSGQKQRLKQHKAHIIQKLKEFGKYDDIADAKEADVRERILKKYLWALSFHNLVCMVYGIPDCMIKSGSTFDVRFMKMTVEVLEDNLSNANQQEEN